MTKKTNNLPTSVDAANSPLDYKDEFETVYSIISAHKRRAMSAIHNESLNMLWEVGAYVSNRLRQSAWGDGVVRMLAEYIHTKSPEAKGWSYRTIYKMMQFYETYSSESFTKTVNHFGMQNYLIGAERKQLPSVGNTIVPVEMAQINSDEIMPFEMAQIPNVLFSTGWTNHQIIMSKCKTDSERMFYKVDLLFYHRLLQCMVAIELKTDEFQPKDLGQLEFYLEALDQEERRSNENPSIGIILCKDADMEVVRYALNRSMSPTMVALYKEQLQADGVIKRSLEEFCNYLTEGKSKN